MKLLVRCILIAVVCFVSSSGSHAQWQCLYSTYDTDVNGTGNQTPAVGIIKENLFVSLVSWPGQNSYMIHTRMLIRARADSIRMTMDQRATPSDRYGLTVRLTK